MDRERVKELLPIMQAYAEGKEIEFLNTYKTWEGFHGTHSPIFADDITYRIKPEPKKRLMTRGEVLYKVTTTPGIVARMDKTDTIRVATCYDYVHPIEQYEWARLDNTGEIIDGWHKFEVEE